jgi:hypothetical protein
MLSFKEYSQLNESPDAVANIIKHIIDHPKVEEARRRIGDKIEVHKRAAKYWWQEHGPGIIDGYTGSAAADRAAPDVGGPAVVHSAITSALEGRELFKSYMKHVEAAKKALSIIKNPEVKAKQKTLGLSK